MSLSSFFYLDYTKGCEMSTPPIIDPNIPIADVVYQDALTHGKKVIDYITNAAADGCYIDVKRVDNKLVVKSMKGDQDLYLTRTIAIDYTTTTTSDEPRQVTVPLDGSSGVGYTMGPSTLIKSSDSATYQVLSTDVIIRGDCTTAPLTASLPTTPVIDEVKVFKKIDASDNTFNISGHGYLIDGQATVMLYNQFQTLWIQFNGTAWDILVTQASL